MSLTYENNYDHYGDDLICSDEDRRKFFFFIMSSTNFPQNYQLCILSDNVNAYYYLQGPLFFDRLYTKNYSKDDYSNFIKNDKLNDKLNDENINIAIINESDNEILYYNFLEILFNRNKKFMCDDGSSYVPRFSVVCVRNEKFRNSKINEITQYISSF